MHFTIYRITNKLNSKTYIGKHQTINLDDGYMGSGKYLKHAIAKYGIENFTKEIIHVFESEEEMNAKERELVTEEFCARVDTYNICEGGKGGFGYINRNNLSSNNHYTEERRKDKSKIAKLNWETNPNMQSILNNLNRNGLSGNLKLKYPKGTFFGKKHSNESKKLIGENSKLHQTGVKNSQYGSFWITDGISNKKTNSLDTIPTGWYKGRITKIKEN